MSDFLERIRKEKKDSILRSGKSFDEWEIMCPYCAYEQRDIFEWNIQPNDEENEEQCQSCERHFMYSARIVYSTRKLK
jgi:hypothetical protein